MLQQQKAGFFFLFFMCRHCGFLSAEYCNMSTNQWLPPSVCAVTRGQRTRFPIIPEGCWVTAWAESSPGLGIFFFSLFLASQTLSAQTCAKWKQTQPRLLITIHLDLCPCISPTADTKWPTLLCTVLNIWFINYIYLTRRGGAEGQQEAATGVRGAKPQLVGTMRPIFQTILFFRAPKL